MGALERGGDRPAGPRGMQMGCVLGFFESLSFFQIGNEAVGLRGLSCLICVCVFRVVLVSLIVVPDSSDSSSHPNKSANFAIQAP